MRVLVVETVHHPRDARVAVREIGAILEAGHAVTMVGPFSAFGVDPPPGVRGIDVPRSEGRHRLAALRAARREIEREAPLHDVVLVHSPELLMAVAGVQHPCVVWDIHEDTAAAVGMKPWMPGLLARPAAWGVRTWERWAERRLHLILAEHAYADRFQRSHPVVPNTPVVPASVRRSERGRVVYVGSVTRARGCDDLIDVGRRLADRSGVTLEVIGGAGPEAEESLRGAQSRGWLTWHGYVSNDAALDRVEGATAGLSLLHDQPNYRHSMPTKLLEYLAHGVPFITTPLPLAVDLARESDGGVIVPFNDPEAVVRAIEELNADDGRRQRMADAGRTWVAAHADWTRDGPAFVRQLEEWAAG